MSDSPSLYFDGGTLVIAHQPQTVSPGNPFQWIKGKWRCEAYHYPQLSLPDIRDTVPRWQALEATLETSQLPHDYQVEALKAWENAGCRGSVVLPTGAGKTFLATQIIHHVNRSALVVAPTIDLLHQWYARLSHAFNREIGVYYGSEKVVLPLTVTTYHSAGDLIAAHGNAFKLLIFDEVWYHILSDNINRLENHFTLADNLNIAGICLSRMRVRVSMTNPNFRLGYGVAVCVKGLKQLPEKIK
jgi:hypothetical protein